MGKRYSEAETKAIVEMAENGTEVKAIIVVLKEKFGVERSELAVKGHIRAFGKPSKTEVKKAKLVPSAV